MNIVCEILKHKDVPLQKIFSLFLSTIKTWLHFFQNWKKINEIESYTGNIRKTENCYKWRWKIMIKNPQKIPPNNEKNQPKPICIVSILIPGQKKSKTFISPFSPCFSILFKQSVSFPNKRHITNNFRLFYPNISSLSHRFSNLV